MSSIFLGTDPNQEHVVRLPIERHALTIAGSRSGKGACQIIPTLREWQGSAIVIDPKGEAARNTIEQRLSSGQRVAILDPMRILDPSFDQYRCTFNPLTSVRQKGAGFRDLMMIADGLVLTTGQERDPHWNESALGVIAGCLAFLATSEGDQPDLGHLHKMLNILRTPGKRDKLIETMSTVDAFGGLAKGTAALLANETNETSSILSTAARHLRFLGDEDILSSLRSDADKAKALDLSNLRNGTLTLYIVMDPASLVLHSRFMRLFVRLALSTMMQTSFSEGSSGNAPCLFVLDEFFSLGKISDIQKAAGLMPGYNVHLWPILQDWGQLVDLYDKHGAQTFLANADAVCVFGVSDHYTLSEVSSWIGELTVDEMEDEALRIATQIETSETWRTFWNSMSHAGDRIVEDQKLRTQTALLQSRVGQPKALPADIQSYLGKSITDTVARRMYVFLRTGQVLDLVPTPYFQEQSGSWWGGR